MFSSDKNIETIGQLIQLVKHSIGLQGEYLKLDIMEKTVRIITALLLFAILTLIVIAILFFISMSAAIAMGESIGYPASFGIIAAFHVLLIFLLIKFRRTLIITPTVKFLAGLFLKQ